MSKSIKELTAEIDVIVSKLQTGLQPSSPGKLFGNMPKIAIVLGMTTALGKSFPALTSMINESVRQNQLVEEIAAIAGKTTDEIAEFYKTHLYTLEDIKYIAMRGDKLE